MLRGALCQSREADGSQQAAPVPDEVPAYKQNPFLLADKKAKGSSSASLLTPKTIVASTSEEAPSPADDWNPSAFVTTWRLKHQPDWMRQPEDHGSSTAPLPAPSPKPFGRVLGYLGLSGGRIRLSPAGGKRRTSARPTVTWL